MAVHTITVQLNFNGRQMSVGLTGAQRDIDRFATRLRRLDSNMRESETHVRSWARVMRDSFIVLGLARSAFANVNAVLTAFPAAVIRSSAAIERMTILMAGLDKQSATTAEAMSKATEQVKDLFEIAGQSPFSVDAVTDSFVKLKAAGLDPNAGALRGLIDSIAKFGGSSDQLKRASIAIQQMAGKGVISMEELRQQLGEAFPEAMQTMTRATGYSMAELVKIISLGRLKASGALTALTRQMAFENFGSASVLAQSWTGVLQRLENEWTMFMARIGNDSGFYQNMKAQVEKITALFRSNVEIANLGRQMGQALNNGLNSLVRLIELAAKYKNELAAVARIMAVGFAAHFLHAPVQAFGLLAQSASYAAISIGAATVASGKNLITTTALYGSIFRLAAAYTAARASSAAYTASIRATAASQGILAAAMAVSGAAVIAFGRVVGLAGRAMLALNPYIGLIVMALWGLYEVYKSVTGEAEEFNRVLKEQADQVDETGYQVLLKGSNDLDAQRNKIQASIDKMQEQWGSIEALRDKVEKDKTSGGGSMAIVAKNARAQQLKDWEAYIAQMDDVRARIAETHKKIVAVQTARDDRAMTEAARARISAIEREGADISRAYKTQMEDAYKQIQADQTKNEEQRTAEYAKVRERLIREEADKLIALYDKEIETVKAAIASKGGAMTEAQKQILDKLRENRDMLQNLAANMPTIEILPGGAGKQGKSATGFDFSNYLTSLATRLDQAREKVGEMNKELAKFNVLQRMGKFEGIDPAQIARAEAYAKSLDQVNKQVSLLTKARTQIDDASEGIDRVNAAIKGIEAQAQDNNPFIRYTGSITSAKQRLEDFNKALEKSRNKMIEQAAVARKNGETGVAEALEAEVARINALVPKIEIAVGNANAAFATAGGEAMKNELLKVQRAFMTTSEVAASEIQEMNAWIDQLIAKARQLGQSTPELEALAESLKRNFADAKEFENNPFEQLLHSWQDTGAAMKQVMADATSGMADLLTDFIVDGEADFQAFAKSIIKMMIKIMIQAMITKMMMSMIGGAGGAAAGAASGAASAASAGGGGFEAGGAFAKGGIMTSRGVMALNRYANGGVARRPQVAIFGEGDKPEAFVPLPDGRTIPVTMKQDQASSVSKNGMGDAHINIINQSKEPVQAESSGPRFDGERFVIDIVLNAMSKPGAMRNAVKGAAG